MAVFAASSKAAAQATGLKDEAAIKAEIAEATAAALLQTFQRTENAELSRQMGWNICLAWSQGGITDGQYYGLLDKLVMGAVDVMRIRATRTTSVTSPDGKVTVTAGDPFLSPTPTPTPSPT